MADGFQEITNADDVVLEIRGGGSTSKAGTTAGKLMVSDFTYSKSGGSETKSGVGNHDPIGVSHGSNEYEFEATLEGEDATLYNQIASDDDGTPPDLKVVATGKQYRWVIPHYWPHDEEVSGSDGDPLEYNISGPCMKAERETL